MFRMNESDSLSVMLTAHKKGACVVVVYTKDVVATKAHEATDYGRPHCNQLLFTTEKEE